MRNTKKVGNSWTVSQWMCLCVCVYFAWDKVDETQRRARFCINTCLTAPRNHKRHLCTTLSTPSQERLKRCPKRRVAALSKQVTQTTSTKEQKHCNTAKNTKEKFNGAHETQEGYDTTSSSPTHQHITASPTYNSLTIT